jgi:hypothetical protein
LPPTILEVHEALLVCALRLHRLTAGPPGRVLWPAADGTWLRGSGEEVGLVLGLGLKIQFTVMLQKKCAFTAAIGL